MTDQSSWAGIPIYTPQSQVQPQVQAEKPFEMPKENLREAKEWEGIPLYGQDEYYIGKKFEAFPNPSDSTGVLMEDEKGQIYKSTGETWEPQKFSPKNIEEQPGRTGLRVVGRENPKESLKRFPSPHTSELFGVSLGVKNPDVWAKSEQDLEKPEDTLWSGVRTGMQAVKSLPWAIPQARIPMAIGTFGAEALSEGLEYLGPNEQEIQEFKNNLETHGIEYDDKTLREDLDKGVKKAAEFLPTLGKIYNWLEEQGVPMEAKTPLQKSMSVGSDVAAMSSKGLRTTSAALSMTLYNSLLEHNVPEKLSGFISRILGMVIGEKALEAPEKAPQEPTPPGPRPEIGEEPKTEFERSEDIAKYFKEGRPPEVPQEPITPTEKVGETVSKLKTPGPRDTGISAKNIVNKDERAVMEEANEKYTLGDKLVSKIERPTEEMTPELQSLINDWKDSSDPVEKDVVQEAEKLLKETRKEVKKEPPRKLSKQQEEYEKYMFGEVIKPIEETTPEFEHIPIKTSFLSKRIKELRSGMKHRFENDPENKYGRLTEIINKQIFKSLEDNPKALKAFVEADKFYKEEYAPIFKNKEEITPFLNLKNVKYSSLYENMKKPDTYKFLEPIFLKTPEGKTLLQAVRRDIIEDSLKGIVEKEGQFNKGAISKKIAIEKTLDDLGIGVTREEKNNILRKVSEIHAEEEAAPHVGELEIKSQKWFNEAPAKDIVKELEDVKRIKLYRQKSKTSPEREKQFDKIARDAGIAKIMKNKTPNEITHKDIKEAIRDVNTREYLKETLGKETVAIFEKRIAEIEKWEEEVAKYEEQMKALEKQKTKAAEEAKKSLLSRKMDLFAKIAKKELTMYALNQIPVLPHFLKQGITDATFDR